MDRENHEHDEMRPDESVASVVAATGQGAVEAEPALSISVTKRAALMMQRQLEKRGTPAAAIRFGIRGGGCTGFSYLFEFEDGSGRKNDHSFEFFGVRVLVDAKSMLHVAGTEIDFETGIRGHGFRFSNPQVSDACGCGESITF